MMRIGRVLAAALALLALARAAGAQAPDPFKATVTASVAVAPPPILLTATRDLYFGVVEPGQVVSVPAQPPYPAGTWSAGVRFQNMRKTFRYAVQFTLPTVLTNGTQNIPVSFNGLQYGWFCVWNGVTFGACTAESTSYSPAAHTTAGTAYVIDLPNNTPTNNDFNMDLYIGGLLSVPAVSLRPGTYTGQIRVSIARVN